MENQTETTNVEVAQPITEFEPIQAPKDLQRGMNVDHLGIVLSNLTIFGMILCIAGILGQIVFFVFSGLAFIFLMMISLLLIVVTCGVILMSEAFRNFVHNVAHMSDDMEKVMQFFEAFYSVLPYLSAGFALVSLGSILCLKLNKNFKHTGRFITSCIALGLFVVIDVLFLIGGVL